MSVYVSQRFKRESIRNLPIRARKFLLLPTEEEGLREDKKKCVSLGFRRENDARERINTYRSGAIDDERLDFLRSFLCCWGHFYVWLFFNCLMRFCAWKCVVSMGQRGKSEFFFRFYSFFQSRSLFSRHFFFFDKTKKMIFNLEGLTVYFPYEYLYPVRFKRVYFLTLLFCYHFLRRASLSFLARTIQTTT